MRTYLRRAALVLALGSLGAVGCAEGPGTQTDTDSATDTGADTGDGELDPEGPTLATLDAFQVVAVPLAEAGDAVAVDSRPVPLVAGRSLWVRAKVEVPAGWSQQMVELRVVVTVDDTPTTYSSVTSLSGSSDPADPASGLVVEVPAEAVQPDATYSVTVWRDGETDPSARFPDSGDAELGPEVTGPIEIRIVPFEVDGRIPDTSQSVIEGFEDAVYAYYPTTEVTISVSEVQPNPYPELPPDEVLGDALFDVGVIMEQVDQAPAQVYYYGLMQPAATRDEYDGITGTSQELEHRAGFGIGAGFGDALSQSTLVHELGHLHFLQHAPCGSPDNVDPKFPHDDGTARIEGFDVRTKTFVSVDEAFDLMTYCQPRWVSGYHYAKMADWIQTSQTW